MFELSQDACLTRYVARQIHDQHHDQLHTFNFEDQNYLAYIAKGFHSVNIKYLFAQILQSCPKCRIAKTVTNSNTFKLSQKFIGASSNIHGLLTINSKRNRIIALDFLGPLKMS